LDSEITTNETGETGMTQIAFSLPAPGDRDPCATKYPLVLLHGLSYRDDVALLPSWGRIPEALTEAGAKVFLGGLQAWDTIENNANLLKDHIDNILAETGADKVNLIAHSKGGLEGRYLISRLGMAGKVASYSSICTPHHGTSSAEFGLKLSLFKYKLEFKAIDLFARWLGDMSPNSYLAIEELTRANMVEFNRNTPDAPGVYYQSFGTVMKSALDEPFFALTYWVIKKREGANDGIVPASSCPWGVFRGLVQGKKAGISHLGMVDFKKHDIAGVNIPGFYVSLVADLKILGF
jgi:triacylglycerol lipase